MGVPPPTDDELADVPDDADLDEAFWRDYAVVVAGFREEWVDDVLAERGVAALAAEVMGSERAD